MTFKIPVCNRVEPHPEHGAPLPGGGEWVCFGKGKRWHDPSPEGLNPQEIRLRLAEAALTNYVGNLDQTPAQVAQYVIEAMLPVAYAVEFGVDDIDAACPDPALHEETHPLRVMAGQAAAARDEARETVASQVLDMAQLVRERDALAARLQDERCPDLSLHEEDWVKHKYGQVAEANADAAKAEERVADLKTELLEARADG